MTSFLSTTEPTPADRQLSTKVGAKSSVMLSSTVEVVRCLDQILHILRRPAELREDEGRSLVQDDDALDGERHILGGQRVAGMEFLPGPDLERDRLAVVAGGIAFGDAAERASRCLPLHRS